MHVGICYLVSKVILESLAIFRHLQRFWGASGDYWQRGWENVCDLFGNDEMFIGVWGESWARFLENI